MDKPLDENFFRKFTGKKKVTLKLGDVDALTEIMTERLSTLEMFDYSEWITGSGQGCCVELVCSNPKDSIKIEFDISEFEDEEEDYHFEDEEMKQFVYEPTIELLKNAPNLKAVVINGNYEDDNESETLNYDNIMWLRGITFVTLTRGGSINPKRFSKEFLTQNKVYLPCADCGNVFWSNARWRNNGDSDYNNICYGCFKKYHKKEYLVEQNLMLLNKMTNPNTFQTILDYRSRFRPRFRPDPNHYLF